jgi:hypothetical protein
VVSFSKRIQTAILKRIAQNVQNVILDLMKQLSTTEMREHISEVIDEVRYNDQVFGVGRRNKIEVIIMKYPEYSNKKLDEITNFNTNSHSFDFLKDEPEIYSVDDLKKKHV